MPHVGKSTTLRAYNPPKSKTFFSYSRPECLELIRRAWEEEQYLPQTVRHFMYKLLSYGALRPLKGLSTRSSDNCYRYVSKLVTEARRIKGPNGKPLLPWEAVIDPSRRATHWRVDESLWTALRSAQTDSVYFADIWRGQPARLEVWAEKDGIHDFLKRIAMSYYVSVQITKGQSSATVLREAAERYKRLGGAWTILYVGDHDPSGHAIQRHLENELVGRHHVRDLEIVRVALTAPQASRLPAEAALALKEGDRNCKRFREDYGSDAKGYELDALPAHELRDQVVQTIEARMDLRALRRAQALTRAVNATWRERVEAATDELYDDLLAYDTEDATDAMPLSGITMDRQELLRYLLSREEYLEKYPDAVETEPWLGGAGEDDDDDVDEDADESDDALDNEDDADDE